MERDPRKSSNYFGNGGKALSKSSISWVILKRTV